MSNLALVRKSPTSLPESRKPPTVRTRTEVRHASSGRVSDSLLERGATCAFGDLGHTVFQAIEERIVGGSRQTALVGPFEEDRRLPQRERRVPGNVGHRAPGAGLIAGDQFLP